MTTTTTGVALDRKPRSDRELVAACLDGQEQAWAELIERYKRLIFSVPIKSGLTRDEAADIFQAVCLDLVVELPRLRDPQALASWLIQNALHKTGKWKRRQQRFVADDPAAVARDVGTSDPTPDAVLREIEEEQALRTAVASLAPRCRRMIEMLFFESPARPYRDVAAQLGLAPGSIGFIRNRCLRRLRIALRESGV
jgi:RNA polymerase sigma factor (sigma-70 family)